MERPTWATRPVLIVIAVAVVVAAVIVGVVSTRGGGSGGGSGGPTTTGAGSDVQKKIPVGGGVTLNAEVVTPKGKGPFPLVVMPTSWLATDREYHGLALVLAAAGYQVVGYAQAGFGGSGGEVDYAGPTTQDDASTVITWALAHTRADPKRIGMLGVSYGAGISLLAAARDPRIKAVVAMSTWTDLAACFYPHDTTGIYSLGALLSEAQKAGHLSNQLTSVTNTLVRDANAGGAAMAKLSPARSPASVISGLNKNHPAIMIANGFEDSIIPPQQLVSFYAKLTGPKRLELAAGDHGSPEYTGLLGAPNVTVTAARGWLDHYLNGTATATVKQEPVELQDVVTRAWHSYPSWPATATTLQLGPDGTVSTGAAQTWTASIAAGTDTVATSGPVQISSPYPYMPPKITFTAIDKAHAFVWTGPPVSGATLVTGMPRFTVDAQSSTGSATLVAYLYDVDAAGSASLMSVAPYTVTGATSPTPVSFDLPPMSWTFAPGHRLGVVVDTVDGRWHSASAAGSTVTLSSSAAQPASLSLAIAG